MLESLRTLIISIARTRHPLHSSNAATERQRNLHHNSLRGVLVEKVHLGSLPPYHRVRQQVTAQVASASFLQLVAIRVNGVCGRSLAWTIFNDRARGFIERG